MSSALISGPAPRVYTLAPQADFLAALAARLHADFGAGTDPHALADVTVLTPTRRAARGLAEAFASLSGPGGGACVLPLIRPIGDVDADEPPFEPGELADVAPPPIEPARRRFELARLILAKEGALGRPIGLGGALALAEPLARLIDDLWTEETGDLAALGEQVRAGLPEHLQEALDFIAIINRIWPLRLAELKACDPAQRRSALLHALADRWREAPPAGPVIAAGSTGSIPAAAELMAVVAGLEQGAVILPGLDRAMDDKAWDGIDDAHPMWPMRDFLARLGLDRSAVRDFPGLEPNDTARARQVLIGEALRPAEETSDWLKRIDAISEGNAPGFLSSGFDGLSVVEAPTPEAEARAIALMLRETLETPGRTAMVVTPDRALAQRVSAEMARFGVRLDDSGGAALDATAPGAFLARVLEAATEPGSALALAALTASPLFALGAERARLKPLLDGMDLALRGARPGRDFAAIRKRLGNEDNRAARGLDREAASLIVVKIEAALAPLMAMEMATAAQWARAHGEAAEALAGSASRSGAERLWAGEAGEAAAALIGEFLHEAEALPDMSLTDYASAFGGLAAMRRVLPRAEGHPRLRLLGPLEARLISADRVILAGLNEGVWPPAGGIDPWMSRGMRAEAGLAPAERRLGLAAHDFAQLACAPEAILTRSQRADGAPSVDSRWLWRLKTLAQGALGEAGAKAALASETDYAALAIDLDRCDRPQPAPRPEPRPPVHARPRGMSVSDVRKWIRDPYAIFAKRILRLYPADEADLTPGPRERGTALHEALKTFVEAHGEGALPGDAAARLAAEVEAALAEAGFDAEERIAEGVRLARAARWFLDWEAGRRASGARPMALEAPGEWRLADVDFTLNGRADRIDRGPDGAPDILDYKTGAPPREKATLAGFEPQLPLEAAMLRAGAFDGIGAETLGGLIYLKLSGGQAAGEEHRIDRKESAGELADRYETLLRRLIAAYGSAETGYPSQPKAQYLDDFGDYDRLARRGEWAAAGGEDADGGDAS